MPNILISHAANAAIENWERYEPGQFVYDASRKPFRISESETYFFLIYVHCIFDSVTDRDAQGGVLVYRHLLKRFEDNFDKLKVIFYSPLSQEELVKSKPENYILKLLPFIKVPQVLDESSEWNFQTELKAIIDGNNFPKFNNASENLLSGWSMANPKGTKIASDDKALLVIDDEWKEWQETYKTILRREPVYLLSDAIDIKSEYQKLGNKNDRSFEILLSASLKEYDFIISDLYLWEDHETMRWKTEQIIEGISGLILFRKVRESEPLIPVLVNSTSTKFKIFETLSKLGANAQLAKDTRPDASSQEKLDNYKQFEVFIKRFVKQFGDCWLNDFYRSCSDQTRWKGSWINDVSKKQEILDILKGAILGYKHASVFSKEYLDKFFRGNVVSAESLIVSPVIGGVGKVFDVLKKCKTPVYVRGVRRVEPHPGRNNPEIMLTRRIRNHAAHGGRYRLVKSEDILLLLALLQVSIEDKKVRTIKRGEEFFDKIALESGRPRKEIPTGEDLTHPVFEYVHYFNNWGDRIPKLMLPKFHSRIKELFDNYSSIWNGYNYKTKDFVEKKIPFVQFGARSKPELDGQKYAMTLKR